MSNEEEILVTEAGAPEQAPEEPEKKQGMIAKGIDTINGAIHEKLTELPRSHGFGISLTVILSNILFVVLLTWYNYHNCDAKLQTIDADWTAEYIGGGYEPYKENFKSPTFLCGSYRYNETSMFYDTPCLLEGLTCKDYRDGRCPDGLLFPCMEESEDDEEYTMLNPEDDPCSFDHPLASVLYMQCPTITIAFGSAMGFVTYVQVVVLVIAYGIYAMCNKSHKTERGLTAELQALAKSAMEKNEK